MSQYFKNAKDTFSRNLKPMKELNFEIFVVVFELKKEMYKR